MKQDNKNIFCTLSAGYSSVMMAVKIKEWYPDHNIIFAMANTSKEREESLHFMNKCDKHFNLKMQWIEAEFHLHGMGVTYRVVKYEDLKTNGEIFEEGIKKLGIPNKINKWCNRDMKIEPMRKFADDYFGRNNYSIAVGLRADETHRILKSHKTNNIFYPLMDNGINSNDRNRFWHNQPIKITIPAYKGNCSFCFEKTKRKLLTITVEEPNLLDWWIDMERKYSNIQIDGKDSYNNLVQNGGAFFNRQNQTIESIIEEAKKPFAKFHDEYEYHEDLFDILLDYEDDCGSGCQVF